uniref:bcl-2-interacting killer isoform X2 n=1 Tax=Jaculus jaculus TaxID=51337 RepID=UPI001E1B255F|nr:bcl-2-interacting killer isoform X2 [Jaculus jaculus]
MSEARPISGDVFTETFLHQQALGAPVITEPVGEEDLPPVGDLDLMECLEGSNQVALRLACIGDEMDLRLRSPRLVQLPGMAMHRCTVARSAGSCRPCCWPSCCWVEPCTCCFSEAHWGQGWFLPLDHHPGGAGALLALFLTGVF